MFRKLALVIVVFASLGIGTAAYASDPEASGCYLTSSAMTVDEGQPFTITVTCNDFVEVYGFEFGTGLTATHATTAASSYTAGTFSAITADAWSNDQVLMGENSLALYGVSRSEDDYVSGDVTLGSYGVNTSKTVTGSNSSAILNFLADSFKLSDDEGNSILNMLQASPGVSVTIRNLDLAWLSGNTTVRSDVNSLTAISNASLAIGSHSYTTPMSTDEYSASFAISAANEYSEVGAPNSDGDLLVNVTADMYGHQACVSSDVNLGDNAYNGVGDDVDDFVGTSGVVTLKAGDVDDDGLINNSDFTKVAFEFGDSGSQITSEYEVNISGDNQVDIFDLVHIGRNWELPAADC